MLIVVGVVVIGFGGLAMVLNSPRGAVERTRRFGRVRKLPRLSVQAEQAVMRAQRLDSLVVPCVAAVVGLGLVAIGCLVPGFDLVGAGSWLPVLVLLPLVVPIALVTGVVAARVRVFRPDPEVPRVARLRPVTAADLLGDRLSRVTGVLRWLALASVVTTLVVSLLRGAALGAVGVLGVGVAALVVDLLFGWLEQRVLDRPRPAATPDELAWHDALCGEAINTMRTAREQMLVLAAFGGPGLALAVTGEIPWVGFGGGVVSFGFAAAMVVLLIHSLAAARPRTAVVA